MADQREGHLIRVDQCCDGLTTGRDKNALSTNGLERHPSIVWAKILVLSI